MCVGTHRINKARVVGRNIFFNLLFMQRAYGTQKQKPVQFKCTQVIK